MEIAELTRRAVDVRAPSDGSPIAERPILPSRQLPLPGRLVTFIRGVGPIATDLERHEYIVLS